MPEQRSGPLQQGQVIDCLLVVAHKFPMALLTISCQLLLANAVEMHMTKVSESTPWPP